ncbi:MAG: hypothetical protein K5681_09850 [Treponema sp.]|nr:hypothetical protein [Treponema sp.]
MFFCNPSLFIENFIVEALRENEFEVYVIHDYTYVKSLLTNYPDSMCYFDIDSEMSFPEWFNFIKSFSKSNLKSIYIGVISETAKIEDTEKFLMNLSLPGGFIQIDKKTEKLIKQFADILELNGAKGRRKYLRLDTSTMDDARGYLSVQDKLFAFTVKDISVAGFACSYKADLINLFQKNLHLNNVCINIGRKSIVCACIIFNTFANPNGTATSVMMFTNENKPDMIREIRGFIIENYVKKVDEVCKNLSKDYENYSEPNIYYELKTDRSYVESEEIEEAEELIDEAQLLEDIDNLTEDPNDSKDDGGLYVSS